jgi:hypothetical protein
MIFKAQPFRRKARYIYDENIYFSTKQICRMLGVSESCLSKQLKSVLKNDGCEVDYFATSYEEDGPRRKGQHYKVKHYNMNTAVGLAFRINNTLSRYFLSLYHRALWSMYLRYIGPNYYIPVRMTPEEFDGTVKQLPERGIEWED